MPSLAVIGDVHAHFRYLDQVLVRIEAARPDGILLVGDLGSHHVGLAAKRTPGRDLRYLASVGEVLGRTRALGLPVAWVPGNHDLPQVPGDGNLDGRLGVLAGLRVYGVGGAGPAHFGFSYEWDESAIRSRAVPPCDVILSHAPPARTPLDHVPRGNAHAGSEAIREIAERHRGFLVCGHIHESPGAIQLGDCLCLNAGGLGAPYGLPQVGFLSRQGELDEVVHEDLVTGVVRRWTRDTSASRRS
jgi:Icc-related predicted phosphoesterase